MFSGDSLYESDDCSGSSDISECRAQFESWVSSPPFEKSTARFPDDHAEHAWPGCYEEIEVDLAWHAWLEAWTRRGDFDPETPPSDVQAEIDEALAGWIPYWRKPISPGEWDKLVSQRRSFAISALESYMSPVIPEAPLFLRQLLAKSRYRTIRKYERVRRRAEAEKDRMLSRLMVELGIRQEVD